MFNIYQCSFPLFCPWIGPTLLPLQSQATIMAFLQHTFVKEMIQLSLWNAFSVEKEGFEHLESIWPHACSIFLSPGHIVKCTYRTLCITGERISNKRPNLAISLNSNPKGLIALFQLVSNISTSHTVHIQLFNVLPIYV